MYLTSCYRRCFPSTLHAVHACAQDFPRDETVRVYFFQMAYLTKNKQKNKTKKNQRIQYVIFTFHRNFDFYLVPYPLTATLKGLEDNSNSNFRSEK